MLAASLLTRRLARNAVRVLPLRSAAAMAAVVFLAGCGVTDPSETTPAKRTAGTEPTAPARLRGEPARAARAVHVLARTLRDGEVERLCRPGAVFTSAVVAELNEGGQSCEVSLELSTALQHPPDLTVTKLAFEPGLATAQVRVGRGSTIPLDIVRKGRRWLVSFSNGAEPVGAIIEG
jgi:hypothetical protein